MVDTEQLGRAVIKQALSDAGIGAADNERRAVHPLDRDEARSFLLSQSGSWKHARELWCSFADLDPERLRSRSGELLSGEQPVIEPQSKPRRVAEPPKIIRKRKVPKAGTKLSSVLYYLKRPEGVSLDELMHWLGWNRQSAQTGICDLRMFGIVSKRGPDGRYRIVEAA